MLLIRKITGNIIIRIVITILQFIASILIARIDGARVLGVLALVQSINNLVRFIFSSGFTNAFTVLSKKESIKSHIGTFSLIFFISKLLGVLLTIIIIFIFQYFIKVDNQVLLLLSIFLCGNLLNTFNQIPRAVYISEVNIKRARIPEIYYNLFYQVQRILVPLFSLSVIYYGFSYLISILLIIPIYWNKFLLRIRPFSFDRTKVYPYLLNALKFMLFAAPTFIIMQLDLVLVVIFGDFIKAGIYFTGKIIIQFLQLFVDEIGMVFFPMMIGYIKVDNLNRFFNDIRIFELITQVLFFFIILFFATWGKELLVLFFGNFFIQAYTPLLILTIYLALVTYILPLELYILSGNHKSFIIIMRWVRLLLMILSFGIFSKLNLDLFMNLSLSFLIAGLIYFIIVLTFGNKIHKKLLNEIISRPFIVVNSILFALIMFYFVLESFYGFSFSNKLYFTLTFMFLILLLIYIIPQYKFYIMKLISKRKIYE